jgi:hypothetical protein
MDPHRSGPRWLSSVVASSMELHLATEAMVVSDRGIGVVDGKDANRSIRRNEATQVPALRWVVGGRHYTLLSLR